MGPCGIYGHMKDKRVENGIKVTGVVLWVWESYRQ